MIFPREPEERRKAVKPEQAMEIIRKMYKGIPTEMQEEALENAYAALRRQIPNEVKEVQVDKYICPNCGEENRGMDDPGRIGDYYCPVCGQRIIQY